MSQERGKEQKRRQKFPVFWSQINSRRARLPNIKELLQINYYKCGDYGTTETHNVCVPKP